MADFIDREAVLTEIYQYTRHYWPTVSYVESIIQKQPAADVEPVRHSEWVAQCLLPGDGWVFEDMPYNPHQHSNPICKRCRKGALLDGGEEYVTSPYCPNCGAKMDGDINA